MSWWEFRGFWGILQRSHKGFVEKKAEEYKQKGRLKFSDGLLLLNFVSYCTTERNRNYQTKILVLLI
ncbi:TPA: hypothetical protein ACFU1U_002113, partial [Neisseria subflava]